MQKSRKRKKKEGRHSRGQGRYELKTLTSRLFTGNARAMDSNNSNPGAGVLTDPVGSSHPGDGGERMAGLGIPGLPV